MNTISTGPPSSPAEGAPRPGLFLRQASGLVRQVSLTNAYFFNLAAFIGPQITWIPVLWTLSFAPFWTSFFSAYAWAGILTGIFCILYAVIFAALATIMPRSGGDYVFTSRIISPAVGFVEAAMLVIALIALISVNIPLLLTQISLFGSVVNLGTGALTNSTGWFSTNWVGFLVASLFVVGAAAIALAPVRSFHRIVTVLGLLALGTVVLMFVSSFFISHASFLANLKGATGQDEGAILKAGSGALGSFAFSAFMAFIGVTLLNFIGFQGSAYIAGEVRGNVTRAVLIAVLAALATIVVISSIYGDVIARPFGNNLVAAWGSLFWSQSQQLPGGQPPVAPYLAAIAAPGAWPLWALLIVGGALLNFMIVPVYFVLISRMLLAWGMDRLVPAWFSEVNERTHAPMNAIIAAIVVAEVSLVAIYFLNYNLGFQIWASIVLLSLTFLMPGLNALLLRWRRPELARLAPFSRQLPWMGAAWAAFVLVVYWFIAVQPIFSALTAAQNPFAYIHQTGLDVATAVIVLAIVAFFVMRAHNRRQGIDTRMLFREIPPA
ncbi:MAG: APC family permease [Candidatus Dormibacter sp.]